MKLEPNWNSMVISGIDLTDHPHYVDAYISYGEDVNGKELTEGQLADIMEEYPDMFEDLLYANIFHE